jgi:hypothetical protein
MGFMAMAFLWLSKSTLTKLIAKLVQQLSGGENDSVSAEAIESADDDAPEFVAQSLSERLNMAIEKANQAEKKTIASKNVVKEIKCEINAFEQYGIRGTNLTMCYGYLKSIPPTSVEAERCFSASGTFVTK